MPVIICGWWLANMPKLIPWFQTSARLKKEVTSITGGWAGIKSQSIWSLVNWSSASRRPIKSSPRQKVRLAPAIQQLPHLLSVGFHLGFKRLGIFEAFLIAHKFHQLDADTFSIQVE